MINIVTINYPLKGDHIVNTEINGDETLLDADLVIIDPSEFPSIWEKKLSDSASIPTIYSPNSDRIRNTFASRRGELETLLKNGKTIVTFIQPMMGFKAEINSTNSYNYVTIYDLLPISQAFLLDNLKPGKSVSGNSINLCNSKSLFAPYYKAFQGELEYSAYLDIDATGNGHFFLLNRSDKPVGFTMTSGNGIIALLPPPKYSAENQKLIGTLAGCVKKFLTKHEVTAPPSWVDEYKVKGEEELDKKINELNEQLEGIIEKKKETEKRKQGLTKFKALLYEQGPELEFIVIETFRLFGFKADNRKLDDLEHDIVFESEDGKGIAELEGKDNDSIHISKLDQLNRAADEDFELTGEYPQAILIGNHYRFSKPETRKEPFTEKVHIVAKKKNFGLLTTAELFKAVQYIHENPKDESFKKLCRTNILNTAGDIIKLPK